MLEALGYSPPPAMLFEPRRRALALLALAAPVGASIAPRAAFAQLAPQQPQGPRPGDPSGGGMGPLRANPDDDLPAVPAPGPGAQRPATPTGQSGACQGPRIVRVQFQGLARVSAADLRSSLRVRDGQCLVRADLQHDARALWDLGLFRDVQVASEPVEGGVELRFALDERPTIHTVRIEGNDNLEDERAREVLEVREGATLSTQSLRRTEQRIRDAYAEKGYFLAEVHAEPVPYRAPDADPGSQSNEVDVVVRVRENAQVAVRSIHFVGNNNLTSDDLRGVMQTQEGGFFSFLTQSGTYREEAFRNDMDLLHAAYYDRGYLNVEIDTPRVALSPDRRFLDITITVREGPRYRVGSVRVYELDDNDNEVEPLQGRARVRSMLHVEPGEFFSRTSIGRDVQGLQTFYRDHGYALVEISPDIQPNVGEATVNLGLRVRRGPECRVHRVVIRGNQKTADRVIRREVVLMEGQRYSESAYQLSRTRVNALGFFERVDMSTEQVEGHPERIIVNVEVTERPTGTFQVGAGLSSIEAFILTAQVQQLNLFGRGQTFTLQAQISALRQIFALRFVEPYLFDSNWTGALDVYNTTRAYNDFTRFSTGGSLSAGYPLLGTNDLRLSATYTGEYVSVNNRGITSTFLNPGAAQSNLLQRLPLPNLFQNGFTSALGLALTVDTRDNRLFPTSGVFARLGVEVADPYTGSQNTYVRWSAFARFFVPIASTGIVFKSNFTGGLVTSRNPLGVPIFERFFLGGITDVRGYNLRSVGPRLAIPLRIDPNEQINGLGPAIGGNVQFYYNLELEFPIVQSLGLRGVVFTDGGNAWNLEDIYCNASGGGLQGTIYDLSSPCNRNPFLIRTSAGFGFRWFSPLGLLRFEWAWPFTLLPTEQPSVFQFTIGNMF